MPRLKSAALDFSLEPSLMIPVKILKRFTPRLPNEFDDYCTNVLIIVLQNCHK